MHKNNKIRLNNSRFKVIQFTNKTLYIRDKISSLYLTQKNEYRTHVKAEESTHQSKQMP